MQRLNLRGRILLGFIAVLMLPPSVKALGLQVTSTLSMFAAPIVPLPWVTEQVRPVGWVRTVTL